MTMLIAQRAHYVATLEPTRRIDVARVGAGAERRPTPTNAHRTRPYGVGRLLQALPAGLIGRTLLAGFVWPESGSG